MKNMHNKEHLHRMYVLAVADIWCRYMPVGPDGDIPDIVWEVACNAYGEGVDRVCLIEWGGREVIDSWIESPLCSKDLTAVIELGGKWWDTVRCALYDAVESACNGFPINFILRTR